MKRIKIAAALFLSVMLIMSLTTIAFASEADYDFNPPSWLSYDGVANGEKLWKADQSLAYIGILCRDNDENYRVSKLTSVQKQELLDIFEKNINNGLNDFSEYATLGDIELINSGVETVAGYDAFGAKIKTTITYNFTGTDIDVDLIEQCYVFTSIDHIITVELVVFSGNSISDNYSITDLEQAIEDGFVINEKMPSDYSGVFGGLMVFALIAVVAIIVVIKIVSKAKAKKQNEQYAANQQYPQPGYGSDPYQTGYGQQQYPQPQYNQPQYTQPQQSNPYQSYTQPQYTQPQQSNPYQSYTQPQYTQPQQSQPQQSQPQRVMISQQDKEILVKYKSMYDNGQITREQYTQVYNKIIERNR